MGNLSLIDTMVLVIYFAAMAAIGPLFASKSKTTEGYFLGDRNFPGWLIGFSMFATSISSITFMAYPADAYKTAWFRIVPAFALPVAILVALYCFLPFFRRHPVTSAYEYLEDRFGPLTRIYAAWAFILFQVVRCSMILFLIAVLLNNMFGLDPYTSIILGGAVTTFYSVLGGIRAVVWTDFIQSVVMWVGGLVSLGYVIYSVDGGLGEIFRIASTDGKFGMSDWDATTQALKPIPWSPDLTQKTVSLFFLVGIGNWLMEYSSNQTVIQRYAACGSAKQARIAIIWNMFLSIPTWCLFMFIGTSIYVFYKLNPNTTAEAIRLGLDGHKADEIFPFFIIDQLPVGVIGLIIAAVLAAAMSSLSSSLNSVSAVGVVDIYRRHIAKDKTDTHYVFIAKSIGVVMGCLMIIGSTVLYRNQQSTLQDISNILTALTSGGLLGIYILGIFTKKGDDRSMMIAIGVTVIFIAYMALVAAAPKLGISIPMIPYLSKIDSYYVGLLGHIMLFVIAYLLASLLPKRERDLHNLTIYTQDDTPLQ